VFKIRLEWGLIWQNALYNFMLVMKNNLYIPPKITFLVLLSKIFQLITNLNYIYIYPNLQILTSQPPSWNISKPWTGWFPIL
jgi:hypothetical protein